MQHQINRQVRIEEREDHTLVMQVKKDAIANAVEIFPKTLKEKKSQSIPQYSDYLDQRVSKSNTLSVKGGGQTLVLKSKPANIFSHDHQRPQTKKLHLEVSQQSSETGADCLSKKDKKRERDQLRRRIIEEKKEKRRLKDRERRLRQKLEKEKQKREEEERILFQKRRDEKVFTKLAEKKTEEDEKQSRKKINIEV